jgi:hypothetical protein
LIAINPLYPVIAGKDPRERWISQQGRFKELRKVKVLRQRGNHAADADQPG